MALCKTRIEVDGAGYYEQTFDLVDETRSGFAWDIDGSVPPRTAQCHADDQSGGAIPADFV